MGMRISAQLGPDGGLWYAGPGFTLSPDEQWAGLTSGEANDVTLTYRPGLPGCPGPSDSTDVRFLLRLWPVGDIQPE